jgi:uncharacterized protein YbaR (Trm112 family)
MGSIQIPFDIGEQVWWVGRGHHEEWITCPECNGDKALTLIQGNGEKVSINCACCSLGYEPPTGTIKRNYYHFEPQEFICRTADLSFDDFRYTNNYGDNVNVKDSLFKTKEECQKRCEELNAEKEKDEERRLLVNTESKRRDMAWSVHYWGRKVGDLKKELEFAQKRLSACKQKKGEK